MKKLLMALLTCAAASSFAMTTVNLDTSNYHCNGTKLTSQTTITSIQNNCHNVKVIVHAEPTGGMYADREPGGGAQMTMITPTDDDTMLDKVEFYSDKNTYLICYYKNNKYVKCKAKPAKKPAVAKATTSAPSAATNAASAPVASK